MLVLVKWCLKSSYLYGRLTGVINFEFDFKKGQSVATNRTTICSAFSHLLLFTLLIGHAMTTQSMSMMWKYANSLHEYVFVVIAVFRLTCVFLALVSRWSQRRTFMQIFNSFWSLYQNNPRIIQFCQRGIVSKYFCVTVAEAFQVIVTLTLMRNRLTFALALRIWAVLSLTAVINVIIMQYFITIASIRGRYILLNKDLLMVVAETRSLYPNRSGVFVTRCCSLADRLEEIATEQADLQKLTEHLSKAYQGQVVCLAISYYLNMVGSFYLLFSTIKYKGLTDNSSMLVTICTCAYFVFYYIDCCLNALNILYLLDEHDKMVKLLDQRTLFRPGLDDRLEKVFEDFILNLSTNPLKLRFLGLFEIDRISLFALGNSLLTHSLLLIQYDVENF
ncbi:putative gustatory receptor 59d [Drosophila takahashii]|uniref:putative gustatory receptor 59d n=1 Tax=Drosophila takahashii TaxID=29030 RepID=UPI001CF877C9|nr:putative gustatory receptor 59d [Drosophila takahashii]